MFPTLMKLAMTISWQYFCVYNAIRVPMCFHCRRKPKFNELIFVENNVWMAEIKELNPFDRIGSARIALKKNRNWFETSTIIPINYWLKHRSNRLLFKIIKNINNGRWQQQMKIFSHNYFDIWRNRVYSILHFLCDHSNETIQTN